MRDIIMAKLFGGGNATPNLTWDDLGRGVVPVLTNVDDFTTTFTGASGGGKFWASENPKLTVDTLIGVGDYLVTFDGVEYVVTAKKYEGEVYFFLGNAHLYRDDMDDTGEPFCIGAQGTRNYVALTNTPGEHTYKIQRLGEGIIPIPEEYLPQSAGGGGSMEPIVIFINDEPMTASVTFEEAWSLSVSELAARLRACLAHDDIEIGSTFATVMKNNTRTWGRHIVIRFDYMDATSEFVIAETGYILWAEGADPQHMPGGMP